MRTRQFQVSCAKRDMVGVINALQMKYELNAIEMDGIISAILADVRSGVIAEVLNGAEKEISDIINDKKE